MSDCNHKSYHRVAPDQPYTCMACGAPEVEEIEIRRFEYKVERWQSLASRTFTMWLNEFGDDGWQLVNAEDDYYTFMREKQ